MESEMVILNKEQYALREINNKFIVANKIISNIIERVPREYFEKGELYFKENDFINAIKCYSLAIEKKGNFSNAYCKRAYSYFNLDDKFRAIADFDKAILYKPDYNDAFFGRANTKFAFNDSKGSIEDFTQAIRLESKDAYAFYFRGKLRLDLGDLKGCIEDMVVSREIGLKEAKNFLDSRFSSILEIIKEHYESYCEIERLSLYLFENINDDKSYFKRGLEKYKIKDYKNAIMDFQIVVSLRGVDSAALGNIATSYFYSGNLKYDSSKKAEATIDYNNAILYCDKIIELDPTESKAYLFRGASKRMLRDRGTLIDLIKAKDLGESIAEERIMEIIQEQEDILANNEYFKRGNSFYEDGNLEGAILNYSKSVESEPTFFLGHYWLGVSKLKIGDCEGAEDAFTESIYLNPRYEYSYLNRGDAKYDSCQFEKAIEDYSTAIKINSKLASAYLNRGSSKYKLLDYQGAINDFTEVLKIDPKYFEAYHHRGISKRYLNDNVGAIRDFTVVIDNNPNNAKAYFDRGAANLSLSKFDEARADLLKSGQLGCKEAYDVIDEYLKK